MTRRIRQCIAVVRSVRRFLTVRRAAIGPSAVARHAGSGSGATWLPVAVVFVTMMVSTPTTAQASDGSVTAALENYAAAQNEADPRARAAAFERAALAFLASAAQHTGNADLLANAGTAALQAQRPGLAALALRRALIIDPLHERARTNLAAVRNALPGWVPRPRDKLALSTLVAWHARLGEPAKRTALSLAALVAGLSLAGAFVSRSRWARIVAGAFVPLWFALLMSMVLDISGEGNNAVIMTETHARAADSDNAPLRYRNPLPAGTEVVIVEHRPGWLLIRLADGREAWVRPGAVRTLAQSPA